MLVLGKAGAAPAWAAHCLFPYLQEQPGLQCQGNASVGKLIGGPFWQYFLFCCMKQFLKIWIHTVLWSKSICFTPLENVAKSSERIYREGKWHLLMKSLNKLTIWDLPVIYFIHSLFHPHPPGCMCWGGLAHSVWHKGHGTSNPFQTSWPSLDWQPWTDRFFDKLFIPSRSQLLLWVVLYIEYSFLQSLSHKAARLLIFFINKHTFLLIRSASLLGLQAREWQKSHGAILLPTTHCYGTGSTAGKTPVQWSYRVQTFCPGLTKITHFDFYCLECPVLSIHMISLTFDLSSSAYIPTPSHVSFLNIIIFLLKSYACCGFIKFMLTGQLWGKIYILWYG